MPFQPGNKEGAKSRKAKPFRDALMMEIMAAGEDHRALRGIARALIETAGSGDVPAIKEIADRLDGKVAQAIVGEDENGNSGPLVITWLKS